MYHVRVSILKKGREESYQDGPFYEEKSSAIAKAHKAHEMTKNLLVVEVFDFETAEPVLFLEGRPRKS